MLLIHLSRYKRMEASDSIGLFTMNGSRHAGQNSRSTVVAKSNVRALSQRLRLYMPVLYLSSTLREYVRMKK
jgi:hypothetical protein